LDSQNRQQAQTNLCETKETRTDLQRKDLSKTAGYGKTLTQI